MALESSFIINFKIFTNKGMFVQRSGSVREKIHMFMLLLIKSYKTGPFLLRWGYFVREVGREKQVA